MRSNLQILANRLQFTAYCFFAIFNTKAFSKEARHKRSLLLAIYGLLLTVTASAQLYPVQVNQVIIPPYHTTLNSYATSSEVKLRLYLTLNDITINNRQVRLKLKIKGQGLSMESVAFVSGAPSLFLNGGTQQQLTNIDLAPYFQLTNLVGISAAQYNNPLPDGNYKVCWEVYDFLSGQRISDPNLGCSNMFLLLNDPPFLNLPNRGDQLTNLQPTNIIFQWTPRHANATNVSYEFELREIWDNQIDPQAGFLASPTYHSETTYATTLLYNIAKPPLNPEQTYAWRVRAKSTTGLSENAIFRNNGYSEIFYFTYTAACYPPTFTLAEPLSKGMVKISWQTQPDHNKYHIQYKQANVLDAEWFEVFSYNNQVQVSNLQDGVTYDFRVGGTCHALTDFDQAYSYSSINQFTMPTADETLSYSCGIIPEIEITNSDPLDNIGVNETFTAGDFPVTIKQIEGGNGVFSGTGFIIVPYLADTKIAVEFSAIKINTDYELFDGIIKTTYDPTWSGVENVEDLFYGNSGQQIIKTVNFQIEKIVINPNGDILVVGVGGQPVVEYAGGEDYIITDQGNPDATPPIASKVYHVDEEGNITSMGETAAGGASTAQNTNGISSQGEAIDITAQGVLVTFTASPSDTKWATSYGFDAYNSRYPKTKTLYKNLEGKYYVPYKAVPKGESDYIVANLNISNDSIRTQDIIFKTKDGAAIAKVDSTIVNNKVTRYTLKLTGTASDAIVETQAVIKQSGKYQIAGVFTQYQASFKNVNVVLVNTSNTVNIQDVKKKLIAIYKSGMANLNITEINDFREQLDGLAPNGTIASGESGFLANYTEQQRLINSAIKSRSDYNENSYYLILTNKKPSTSGEQGLMPIGKQFGYIYTSNSSSSEVGWVSAHELGHGAFQLKHPFSSHSYGWPKGATNWLMDYTNTSEHLPYEHWEAIQNPNIHIGIFDGDSEGEYTFENLDYVCVPVKYQTRDRTYVDLDGNSIVLGAGFAPVAFVGTNTPEALGRISIVKNTDNGKLYYPLEGKDKKYYWTQDKKGKYSVKFSEFAKSSKSPTLVHVDSNGEVYVNGIATGEVQDGARDCLIIPKKRIPSKNDGSRCSQFEYFDVTQFDDLELLNEYQVALNVSLEKSLLAIPESSKNEIRKKGVFNHIQFAGSSYSPIGTSELEILEDKLHLLSNKLPDTYVVVSFLQVSNNHLVQNNQIEYMAKQAINQKSTLVKNKKVVYIVVPFSNYESIFGVGLFNSNSCFNISYAENINGVITNNATYQQKEKISESIIELYKSIKKPLYIKRFYITAGVSLKEVAFSKEKSVTGYDAINVLQFYKSSYIKQIETLRSQAIDVISQFASVEITTENRGIELLEEYERIKSEMAKLYNEAAIQEVDLDVIGNKAVWGTQPYIPDNLGKLREVYIFDKKVSDAYFVSQISSFGFGQNFSIYFGNNLDLDNDEHFYKFDAFIVFDPLVYGLADGLSFIPVPPLDSIGDGLGFIYASARGDMTQAPFYAMGLVLPVGAGYLKMGTNVAGDVFVIVAKKTDAGKVILSKKLRNAVKANELVVTTPLSTNGDKVEEVLKILNEDDNYRKISKYFDDVAEVGGDVFASLKNKVSSLNSSAIAKIDNTLKAKPTIIRFDYAGRVSETAEQFLKIVADDFYDIIFKNGAYAKFDKSTGRMLYVEGEFQAFVRYTNGNGVSDIKGLITDRVTKMRNILGLNGAQTINLSPKMGSLAVSSNPNKVLTFIGKTDETQLLKNIFGDFKHIEVGEIKGGINLLNRSDVNWIPERWWKDYNKGWMLRAINRGDDIYIASPITPEALFNFKKVNGVNKPYGSYYSRELYEMVKANLKPKNISQTNWNTLIPDIKKAALTNILY